jgi:N-acetylmuramoyl-L-alanine amidase
MMTRFIMLGLVAGLVATGWAEPRPLKSSRFGGRSYVAVRDLAEYYGLERDQARSPGRAEYRTSFAHLVVENERRDVLLNGVTHWLSIPVLELRNQLWVASLDVLKVIDPVLRQGRSSTKSSVRTVVLDPGHGGGDTGTRGSKSVEKTLTLDLAKRVERQLELAGVNVILTRTRDETFGLPERVEFAERKRADLFVSLHFNSGGSAEGVETYCVPPAGAASTATSFRRLFGHDEDATCPGNKSDERNVWLAHCVHRSLLKSTGANDRGVRRARFVVIRDAKCPAILVESGFLSNRSEEARILTTEYRDKLAKAIADGILAYKKAVE